MTIIGHVKTTVTRVHPFGDNGKSIRRLRLKTGKSQETVAVEIGTTRRHMIRLENGEHLPTAKMRERLAAALGVDGSEIQSCDDEDDEEDAVSALTRALRRLVHEELAELVWNP